MVYEVYKVSSHVLVKGGVRSQTSYMSDFSNACGCVLAEGKCIDVRKVSMVAEPSGATILEIVDNEIIKMDPMVSEVCPDDLDDFLKCTGRLVNGTKSTVFKEVYDGSLNKNWSAEEIMDREG